METPYLVTRTTQKGAKVYRYRREVPVPLRSILGREIKRTLRTSDEGTALKLWAVAHAQAERMIAGAHQSLAEATASRKSPAIGAYKAVQAHVRGD